MAMLILGFTLLIFNILVPISSEIDLSKVDCSVMNAVWDKCPSPCPETCEFLSATCFNACGGPCVCRDDYVMDGDRKTCVLRSECPLDLRQRTVKWHFPITIKYFGSYILYNLTDSELVEV
ncbi:hypothetical protein KR018_001453 [Drosophila ironensis]|nr:hypothetical protein KR018_001453 [Drosophila ironensis]